ncbi:Protein of unknown function [Thalassovita taeanensis]|uniref:DUF3445 domain-containing protein n=2 Tax=Thalassovita taeanensis TaxID=657014 RepID=A0A1H9HSI0_9RHOB|nr:Protein of unknown function [Thalassovita taeanensis]
MPMVMRGWSFWGRRWGGYSGFKTSRMWFWLVLAGVLRHRWCMSEILQNTIPYDVHSPRPLPGIAPLPPKDWLLIDEAYGPQMAERTRLLRDHRAAVLRLDETARPAAEELLEVVLEQLRQRADFSVQAGQVVRPDGQLVQIDRADPLATLGQLVQDDLCLLEKRGEEHVLTGAVLCFPASWTLAEKFMRPLIGIHVPVDVYDAELAKRVQRLFDGVQPGRPLWRFNALWYADACLHQPRPEAGPRRQDTTKTYLRSERQALMRLPLSRAVVFSIHTFVLSAQDAARL